MTIERDGKTWEVFITAGYVAVKVPVFDCEGTQRTIDFPRVGFMLYGQANLHWTTRRYLWEAKKVAKVAIAEYEYACVRSREEHKAI